MESKLSGWRPCEKLGAFKYLLYGPFIANALLESRIQEGDGSSIIMSWRMSWCLHLLIICALRCEIYHWFTSFSSMLFLTRRIRINKKGVEFDQIDKEHDWDNFIILQAYIATLAWLVSPTSLSNLPLWNTRGLGVVVLFHVFFSEPVYYWAHRLLFHGKSYFFTHFHYFHHSSAVVQPTTAGSATFLEHLFLSLVMGVPLIGACLLGYGSVSMIYVHVLVFDFLRSLGHCNVEIVSHRIFEAFPFLRYIVYTPTYHSLHHKEMGTNFCLFMPLYDALGNTINNESWTLHKKINLDAAKNTEIPDFVFLAHAVDITTSMHQSFTLRSFASNPYKFRIYLLPFWPIAFLVMLAMWAKSKPFVANFYNLRGRLHQMWAVPRFGFQYFLPFAVDGINKQIEMAIVRADRLGVKVISLAALNKNEALNGGGTLFVNKYPNLKVRVVHGNTLTAAVILNDLPQDVEEVFLTGATSKLGRAIALYLCRRRVKVLMLTLSVERFQNIQKETPLEYQKYLVQVTKYQAARNCKIWIVGKWITPSEQSWAPSGAHFNQFVVPPILHFRRDCTYGDLAAIRLPKDVEGLGYCEYKLERGVVHACHAGGVVHFLEGWTHHEVGAIDVDRIDVVWNAAMKHGLKPVSDYAKLDY